MITQRISRMASQKDISHTCVCSDNGIKEIFLIRSSQSTVNPDSRQDFSYGF